MPNAPVPDAVNAPQSKAAALANLIATMFNLEQLKSFLSLHYPEVHAAIEGDTDRTIAARRAALRLEARGEVKQELWSRLKLESPERSDDIDKVRRKWEEPGNDGGQRTLQQIRAAMLLAVTERDLTALLYELEAHPDESPEARLLRQDLERALRRVRPSFLSLRSLGSAVLAVALVAVVSHVGITMYNDSRPSSPLSVVFSELVRIVATGDRPRSCDDIASELKQRVAVKPGRQVGKATVRVQPDGSVEIVVRPDGAVPTALALLAGDIHPPPGESCVVEVDVEVDLDKRCVGAFETELRNREEKCGAGQEAIAVAVDVRRDRSVAIVGSAEGMSDATRRALTSQVSEAAAQANAPCRTSLVWCRRVVVSSVPRKCADLPAEERGRGHRACSGPTKAELEGRANDFATPINPITRDYLVTVLPNGKVCGPGSLPTALSGNVTNHPVTTCDYTFQRTAHR